MHPSGAVFIAILSAGIPLGCKASVSARADVAASQKTATDLDEPIGAESLALAEREQAPPAEPALLGARADLRLASGQRRPTCRCLAVHTGAPSSPGFDWQVTEPSIYPETQIVVAFTSEGTGCDREPEGSLGASYWGYEIENADVVVVVEAARFGRPVTTGAIIPRPAPDGRVLIRPVRADVPYGQPLSGNDACVARAASAD